MIVARLKINGSKRLNIGILPAPHSEIVAQGQWPRVIRDIQLVSEPTDLAVAPSYDIRKEHKRIAEVTVQNNLPVRFVGYGLPFSGRRDFTNASTDWSMFNLLDDEAWKSQNFQIPEIIRRDLDRIWRAGLNFDQLYVAHEFEKGKIKAGQPIPLTLLLPPPPTQALAQAQQAGEVADSMWKMLKTTVGGTAKITKRAATALSKTALSAAETSARVGNAAGEVTAATVASVGANLDPLIFGVILDRKEARSKTPLAMWYYLTHWTWA